MKGPNVSIDCELRIKRTPNGCHCTTGRNRVFKGHAGRREVFGFGVIAILSTGIATSSGFRTATSAFNEDLAH